MLRERTSAVKERFTPRSTPTTQKHHQEEPPPLEFRGVKEVCEVEEPGIGATPRQ